MLQKYFSFTIKFIFSFLLTNIFMKTDTNYILQHSLLTREVFIITYIIGTWMNSK